MTDVYECFIHYLLYQMLDCDSKCMILPNTVVRTLQSNTKDKYKGLSDNNPEILSHDIVQKCETNQKSRSTFVDVGQIHTNNNRYDREINCITCHESSQSATISNRVLVSNEKLLSDEELLSLILSRLVSTTDAEVISTNLIRRFDTIGAVISARSEQLMKVYGVTEHVVSSLKAVGAAGVRLAREDISNRSVIDAWDKLITYLRATMSNLTIEQFRVLFLDRRNVLLLDEVQHEGTIDHTPVYPREIVKRALELDSSAIIMVHNHPSNHPAPSKGDIEMTKKVQDILEGIGMILHDHIIVSRRGHTSFRQGGWL